MSIRTVRLDLETEDGSREVKEATGLSIAAILKRGLLALEERVRRGPSPSPHDV